VQIVLNPRWRTVADSGRGPRLDELISRAAHDGHRERGPVTDRQEDPREAPCAESGTALSPLRPPCWSATARLLTQASATGGSGRTIRTG
jgi:hypothetical protein